jgi:hypothetical protein
MWVAIGVADSAQVPPPTDEIRVGKVTLDLAAEQRLQIEVDKGHMPWRLDPIEVAQTDGQEFGFVDADRFRLLQPPAPRESGGSALVRAAHADQIFEIRLIQPVRIGPDGIWAVDEVRAALRGAGAVVPAGS